MTTVGPLLQGRNLIVKRDGITVLDIPNFTIGRGEVLSLIRPNGSGKSTLLLTLSSLLNLNPERTCTSHGASGFLG